MAIIPIETADRLHRNESLNAWPIRKPCNKRLCLPLGPGMVRIFAPTTKRRTVNATVGATLSRGHCGFIAGQEPTRSVGYHDRGGPTVRLAGLAGRRCTEDCRRHWVQSAIGVAYRLVEASSWTVSACSNETESHCRKTGFSGHCTAATEEVNMANRAAPEMGSITATAVTRLSRRCGRATPQPRQDTCPAATRVGMCSPAS